jgi:hypothetical protein
VLWCFGSGFFAALASFLWWLLVFGSDFTLCSSVLIGGSGGHRLPCSCFDFLVSGLICSIRWFGSATPTVLCFILFVCTVYLCIVRFLAFGILFLTRDWVVTDVAFVAVVWFRKSERICGYYYPKGLFGFVNPKGFVVIITRKGCLVSMCWTHPSIWVQTCSLLISGWVGASMLFDSLMFQVC